MLMYFSVAVFYFLQFCFIGDVSEIVTQSEIQSCNYGTVEGDYVGGNKFGKLSVLVSFFKKTPIVRKFSLKNMFKNWKKN